MALTPQTLKVAGLTTLHRRADVIGDRPRTTSSGQASRGFRDPTVAVVIVSHNSRADLEVCLPTLARQGPCLEVIVVDNSSADGTVEWLRRQCPEVQVVVSHRNMGFAAGFNRGLQMAVAEYVLALNPDTELAPGSLAEMLHVAVARPRAFVTPKLLQAHGTVNACGNEMHYTGITSCMGLGNPAEVYRGILSPLLLSGAAILARRDDWFDVGGFDEDFFLYMEDADLSLRALLKGHEILCAGDAVITHHYRLKMSPQKFYFLERNRLLTLFKNYEARTLRRMVVGLSLTELATWSYAAIQGPPYLRARARGYRWLWQHRREWRQVRHKVQQARCIPDASLIPRMTCALPFSQLITNPGVARLLERLTTPLYRWGQPTGRRVRTSRTALRHWAETPGRDARPEEESVHMRHLFLSPHLDDAVLSCGGTIAKLAEQAHKVVVLTLFAGEGTPPFSPAALHCHRTWGDPPDAVGLRRAEDIAALSRLGAAAWHEKVPEAIYRRDRAGNWMYPGWPLGRASPGPQVHGFTPAYDPGDEDLPQQLCERVVNRIGSPAISSGTQSLSVSQEPWRIHAPLGVTDHADHQISFEVGRLLAQIGYDVSFYEEWPYTRNRTIYRNRLARLSGWVPTVVTFEERHLRAKIDAVCYYRSQTLLFVRKGNWGRIAKLILTRSFSEADLVAAAVRGSTGNVAGSKRWRGEQFWHDPLDCMARGNTDAQSHVSAHRPSIHNGVVAP